MQVLLSQIADLFVYGLIVGVFALVSLGICAAASALDGP